MRNMFADRHGRTVGIGTAYNISVKTFNYL